MTDDRAAKKAARDRMTRTGERYTAARRAERNMPAAAVPDEQPFFVALVPYHGIGAAADRASIRDARTGKVTALVPEVPGIPRFRAVTAAAGGLFYLTAGLPVRDGRAVTFDTRVFRLAVDSEGQVAELTALPEDLLPPGTRHVAVTPDGSRLVYVTGELSPAGWLTVATATVGTATGQRRSYPNPGTGAMTGLSLAADGRTLAYEWRDAASGRSAVHVVDIGTAGDWLADSRTVASYDGGLRDAICPLISADGSAVYLSVPQPDPKGGPHWNQIVELPLAGGEPRILFALRYTGNPGNSMYMWTTVCRDQRGRFLLAFSPGYAYRVDIAAAASTRLPFPEGMPHEAAW
jgi:hypothetical protein